MELRAKHAEEESKLLKGQMEQLRKRLNEVISSVVLIFIVIVSMPVSILFSDFEIYLLMCTNKLCFCYHPSSTIFGVIAVVIIINFLFAAKSSPPGSVTRLLFMSFDQCMQQKGEMEKKLLSITPQEAASTDTSILVKHLQEELRNYVSLVLFYCNLLFLFHIISK